MDVMETMGIGITTTMIGLSVVLLVLIILSFIILILNKAVDAVQGSGNKPDASQDKKITEKNAEKPSQKPLGNTVEKAQNNNAGKYSPAVVAAITASICALTGKTADEFKIRKIDRVPTGRSIWASAGIVNIMTSRQGFFNRRGKQ